MNVYSLAKAGVCLLFVFVISLGESLSQIPKSPDKRDRKSRRQGQWTVLYNADVVETFHPLNASYYAIIFYKDDIPPKARQIFDLNGALFYEGILPQKTPTDTTNGYAIFYHPSGKIRCTQTYQDDELVHSQYFKEDGTETPPWDVLHEKALALYKDNRYRDAIELFIQAKDQAAFEYGKKPPFGRTYVRSCFYLATSYYQVSEFTQAEIYFLEIKKLLEVNFGIDDEDYGPVCAMLANIYSAQGNFSKAESLHEQATIAPTTADDSLNYARNRRNLGSTLVKQDRYEEAEKYFLEAKSIFEKINPNSIDYANCLEKLANLNWDLSVGMFAKKIYGAREARDLYDEALAIYEKAEGKKGVMYADALVGYSRFYSERDPSRAEEMLLEAQEIRAELLGKEHPDFLKTSYNLAHHYRRQDREQEARKYLEVVVNFQLQELERNFVGLSQDEQQKYFKSVDFFFEDYKSLAAQYLDTAFAIGLFNLQLKVKGFLYQSSEKNRLRILKSGDSALIKQFNQLKEKRAFLSQAYQLTTAERSNKGIDLPSLEEETNSLEKEISLKAGRYGVSGIDNQMKATWRDIQNKLKPDEAAVEVVRCLRDGFPTYIFLILTSKTTEVPDRYIHFGGDELETKWATYYRNCIINQIQDTTSYTKFWDLFAEGLTGFKRIYFSPDGLYHQINLNTLFNPKTGKYLSDQFDIRIVGNLRDLLKPLKTSSSNKAILFGYPDYKDASKGTISTAKTKTGNTVNEEVKVSRYFNRTTESVTQLPGTRDEVRTIDELLKEKNVPVNLFLEQTATEKNLKEVRSPKILHIATHGFFLPHNPKIDSTSVNPLLRSGLLLAGCERVLKNPDAVPLGDEDGVLTAYEALSLQLDNTDLVALSACETGLGEIQNGEGVYGLQRAFQQAGARAVLISLWKVSDEATQLLMTTFYEEMLKTGQMSQALAAARNKVRIKYPAPYYWGAFVLVGD